MGGISILLQPGIAQLNIAHRTFTAASNFQHLEPVSVSSLDPDCFASSMFCPNTAVPSTQSAVTLPHTTAPAPVCSAAVLQWIGDMFYKIHRISTFLKGSFCFKTLRFSLCPSVVTYSEHHPSPATPPLPSNMKFHCANSDAAPAPAPQRHRDQPRACRELQSAADCAPTPPTELRKHSSSVRRCSAW